MEALERYLTECEKKRRRMRDRPSDAVLAELRRLLDRFDGASRHGGAGSIRTDDLTSAPPPRPLV